MTLIKFNHRLHVYLLVSLLLRKQKSFFSQRYQLIHSEQDMMWAHKQCLKWSKSIINLIFTPEQQKTRGFHLNSSSIHESLQKCQSWSFFPPNVMELFHVCDGRQAESHPSSVWCETFGVNDGGDGGRYHLPSAHKAASEWEQSSRSFCCRLSLLSFPVWQEIVPAHSW